MTETPRKWKTSKVLKVGGVIARQGVFTGHSPDLNSQGKPEFKESTFTPTVLEMITNNFKNSLPIYIDHSYEPAAKRVEVGKSFKLGIPDSRDSLYHEGFVWDPVGQQQIEQGGYNQVSPEFDLIFDSQGNIVDAIPTAIVYVRNPAISGTEGQCMAMCFSRGPQNGGDSMTTGDQQAPGTSNQAPPETPPTGNQTPNVPPVKPPQAPPAEPPVKAPAVLAKEPQVQYVTDPALVAKLNELSAKLATYDNVMPGLIQQNETMKTQQLGALANDLKGLGIENPEVLVDSLPIDGKIKALSQLRENLVKTMPMVKPPETMSDIANRASQDKTLFTKALTGLGLTEADYNRVMAGGKINA